jgi:DNA-binding response OmpR family regulator
MSHRILSISYDGPLLVTRQMLLQAYGYDVISAEGFTEALEHADDGSNFDLVIIGHSIPLKDKRKIVSQLRKQREVPVLSLLRHGEAPLQEATESVEPHDPKQLVLAVQRLLGDGSSSRVERQA